MTLKHLVVAGALAALIALSAVVSASGHQASAQAAQTIRLDFKMTSARRVDSAPKGMSVGDYGVVGGRLFAAGTSRQVGQYQGICFMTAAKNGSECTFTLALADGQITTMAAYGAGFNGNKVVHDAIIGGTGAYRTARGEVLGEETGDTTGKMTVEMAR
jgi:allene oxide cyclase